MPDILKRNFALAGALCALPYALVYLVNLWQVPHYQFFPLLLLLVAYFGWMRFSGEFVECKILAICAGFSAVFAVFVIAAAILFASPWMAYLSFLLFLFAFLSKLGDKESDGSLVPLALPLLLIWQPPWSPNVTGDTVLVAGLQRFSAAISSRVLDLLGIVHSSPGTIIECAGKSFGVEEACSGIQSFFSLLCFSAVLVVVNHRGVLHGLLLFAASVFWAIVFNSARITAIPVLFELFSLDLSHGLPHTLIGLSAMSAGILLLISSDRLFQLVPLMGWWDSRIRSRISCRESAPPRMGILKWLCVVFCLLPFLGMQLFDISMSWGQQRKKVDAFRGSVLVDLYESDAPLVGTAKMDRYEHEDRIRGSDYGERSDTWHYASDGLRRSVSLDQAFPGWHELTGCYKNVGWTLAQRSVDPGDGWGFVRANFEKANGDKAYLIFCMFDQAGKPIQPPEKWDSWNSILNRVKNRLSPDIRGRLFRLAAYQVQIVVLHSNALRTEESAQVIVDFIAARNSLRKAVLRSH